MIGFSTANLPRSWQWRMTLKKLHSYGLIQGKKNRLHGVGGYGEVLRRVTYVM
ncbi:hypothetical protein HanOQP8_Chr12g0429881 [Helianthus annuus]|nr:hypothetical protein HanOQP8_Chr12g0429881 [Helianthus annuus]